MAVALNRQKIVQDAVSARWVTPDFVSKALSQNRKMTLKDVEGFLFSEQYRGLLPSSSFDPEAYQEAYPDVLEYPFHPLVHYLFHGMEEGRQAFPVLERDVFPKGKISAPICVALNAFSITGAPMAAFDLYKGLWLRLGHVPQIVSSPHNGALMGQWQSLGVTPIAHGISYLRGKIPEQIQGLIEKHKVLYKNNNIQYLHAHSAFCFAEVLAAKSLGLPVIWTIHEPNADEANQLEKRFIALAIDVADRVLFVSQQSAEAWSDTFQIDPHKRLVIPKQIMPVVSNRKSARQNLKYADREFVALSVGTVCARKGHEDIIAALENWPSDPHPNLRIVMVGMNGSEYANALKSRINRLISMGWKIDIYSESTSLEDRKLVQKLFSAADVFLMTSRAESRPLVVSEAFAHGCPVICTQVDGIEEMIKPGEDGAYYAPEDAKGLAVLLSQMIDAPAQTQAMRQAIQAKQRPDAFDRMLDPYVTLIDTCFSGVLGQKCKKSESLNLA
ncbi:MAG: glycosyltransferase family 4 protein [Planktomarina sp.]